MKKTLLYLLLISGLMISNILVTNALNCTEEEINTYRDKATDINVVFQLIENEGERYFEINILNVEPDFSFVEEINSDTYSQISENSFQIKRYKIDSIGKYSFKFYLKNLSCYLSEIRSSIDITIPRYNEYSQQPSCQVITNLKACQKTLPTNDQLTEQDKKAVEDAYKKYLQEKSSTSKDDQNQNNIIYLLIVVVLIVIIITAIIIVKRNNKIKRRGVI